MAGERIRLEVKDRDSRGSREARRLRREGLVPGVLYGRGKTPHAFCVEQRELRRALSGPSGLHAILDVVLDGQKTPHHAILKSYQQDPLRGAVTLPTQIVEPEPEEELEEGVEVPEGEEAPEGAAEAPAETGGEAAASEPGTVEGESVGLLRRGEPAPTPHLP